MTPPGKSRTSMVEETLADQMRAGKNHQKQSLCGRFAVTGDGPQFSGFVSLAGRISLAATWHRVDAYIATTFGGHLT